MDGHEFPSDSEILSQSGEEALAWYQATKSKERTVRKDFDWCALAKGAALRARISEDEESIAWAKLSTATFQKLAVEQPDGKHDLGEMYCRVAMIEKHGSLPGSELRDAEILFSWFREHVSLDLSQTSQLIERLMDEINDDFVTNVVTPLRDVKSRLTVVRALPKECELPDDIAAFCKLYHQMP